MRILVLGSHGMLGSEFVRTLSDEHFMITSESLDGIDITNIKSCSKIKDINPDIVINCAAYTNVDKCEVYKETCFQVNAHALKILAEVCKDIKIIHFSTDYIFNGKSLNPYKEEDTGFPINVYGLSKKAGEYALTSNSTNYIIVRTEWLFGKYKNNFVTTIMDKSKLNEPLKVVHDQLGSPTYTKDLVLGVNQILDQTGIFHLTNQGHCSWYDFAKEILKIAKIDAEIIPISSEESNRLAQRPTNSVLDNSKFNQLTNNPLRSWKIALQDYLDEIL